MAGRGDAEDTFIGREAELDALRRLLDRAGVGNSQVALLVGEPGVGKTRIARQFAAAAGALQAIVLWGAAYEDWTPPYGPWTRANIRPGATRLVAELIPLLETLTPTTLNQNGSVGLAGAALWELGDPGQAERCRALALALVDAGVGDDVGGSQEHTVARMSSLLGEHAEADEWFERATAKLRADGRRPLHAVAAVDRTAAALAARASVPIPELREARQLADELGMTQLRGRATALLEEAEATPPAGLTAREAEILRLLAEGRTNREIADTLVLSVHTIERHLANAYRKIEARNRAEATAFALRQL